MFRKSLITTLTVAIIAGSVVTAPTAASAANGRNLAAAVAFVAGTVIGAAASSHDREYSGHNNGYGSDGCFEKDFTRYNGYGERVTVQKTICR